MDWTTAQDKTLAAIGIETDNNAAKAFFFLTLLALAALMLTGAIVILVGLSTGAFDDEPAKRAASCTRNDAFVSHEGSMSPSSAGADAVRASGLLVTSDGAGGSCVYEDNPLGG